LTNADDDKNDAVDGIVEDALEYVHSVVDDSGLIILLN